MQSQCLTEPVVTLTWFPFGCSVMWI